MSRPVPVSLGDDSGERRKLETMNEEPQRRTIELADANRFTEAHR
jgi:hypothetical protein